MPKHVNQTSFKKGHKLTPEQELKRVNSLTGRKMDKNQKQNLSIMRIGKNNPNWKEKILLTSLHEWVRRHKPKPEFCEDCNIEPPRDLANISQKYKRDINDFEWLCRRCHMKKDGRIKNLKQYKKGELWPQFP